MKKIMILGAGILQLPAIETAKEMGLEVVVADINPSAVGFNVKGITKELISTIDTPEILKAAKRHNINGIMTLASDMPMRSVAAVSQEMGLVGISKDTALKATNKAFMRDALKKNKVPIPLYFRIREKTTFIKAIKNIRELGYRCIVKPTDNSGSRGVDLISDTSNLDKVYEYTMANSRSREIIVEEYMEGPEVSVETIALEGKIHIIQITDKLTTGAPYFVEMGHSQPSLLDEETKRKIVKVAIAANKAIGIENGPSHTEIKVTQDGPKIVELGARLGGDCITSHLVPLSTGVDMVESCIRIALGEKPDLKPKWNKGAAIRYLNPMQGVVKKISGVAATEAMEDIVQVVIVHGVGEHICDIQSSLDRAGFVISKGENALNAISNAERACENIMFCIEE